jgi:hypothetical protein
MTRQIISVSVTEEELEFLKKFSLSPTFLLKEKLREEMIRKGMEDQDTVKLLQGKIERLAGHIEKYSNFLNEKGLLEEFSQNGG